MHLPNWSPAPLPAEDWENGGFGVYVHWPFCQSKCPYCDFNSHVCNTIDQAAWRAALLSEIETMAERLPGRRVNSIFFGGGTPSLMPPETVAAIIEKISTVWSLQHGAEITLEANPTSVEAQGFAGFSSAGVNRISMGIQSLRDTDLKRLGRMHTAKEARQAFDIARNLFSNVSFDLIYARQDQSLSCWQEELAEAIEMAVDHLSLYQLTIEEGTRFGELHAIGKLSGLPDDTLAVDMYKATQEICGAAGLLNYEVSNHARPGRECKHNLLYWNYGDYVGIGPGSHGRITVNGQRYATESVALPDVWLNLVRRSGTAASLTEAISPRDQASEYLMMSLRQARGSDLSRYNDLSPTQLPTEIITDLQDQNLIENQDNRIRVTASGRMVLNAILKELLVSQSQ